jgi:hypothetical protein
MRKNHDGHQCRRTVCTPPLSPLGSIPIWFPAWVPAAPRLADHPPSSSHHRTGRATCQEAIVASKPRTQVSTDAPRLVKEPIPKSVTQRTDVTPPLWRGNDSVAQMMSSLMERRLSSPPTAPWSCRSYARLLDGESVSWREILQEHPMLGSITVPKLVEAGVVEITFNGDPETAMTDIWLTLQSRANGKDGQMTRKASREPLQPSRADPL